MANDRLFSFNSPGTDCVFLFHVYQFEQSMKMKNGPGEFKWTISSAQDRPL